MTDSCQIQRSYQVKNVGKIRPGILVLNPLKLTIIYHHFVLSTRQITFKTMFIPNTNTTIILIILLKWLNI